MNARPLNHQLTKVQQLHLQVKKKQLYLQEVKMKLLQMTQLHL